MPKQNVQVIYWKGEKSRSLKLCRPCPCGCDEREGKIGAGYITGSDADGHGFTLYIPDEVIFKALSKTMGVSDNA